MGYTRTTNRKLLKSFVIAITGIAICAYALWRSLNYARGPGIVVNFPPSNISTTSTTITIYGQADRVSSASLDGRQITVDEKGNFKENVIVFPGINIITLGAKDQFDRSTEKEIRVFGE